MPAALNSTVLSPCVRFARTFPLSSRIAVKGKVVWRVDQENTSPPGKFADACGGQRLPNGNTVITAYGQKDPAKCRIFEVTRDKKVVWKYDDHSIIKSLTTVRAIDG